MLKKIDINEVFSKIGMNVIIKYKYIVLPLIVLLVVLGYFGTERLTIDNSNEALFGKNDDLIKRNEKFKQIFGNEDFIAILIESDDVIKTDVLKYIRTLSNDLEENLPFARDVTSLSSIEYIDAIEDDLIVEDLIDEVIPVSKKDFNEIKHKLLSKEVYVDRVITKDFKQTLISIQFEQIPDFVYLPVKKGFSPLEQADLPAEKVIMSKDIYYTAEEKQGLVEIEDPRKLIAPALRVILERNENENFKVLATGLPVVDFEIDHVTDTEGTKFLIIAMIISAVLLIILFRNIISVIAPFFIIIFSIIISYGFMGWIGIPMDTSGIIIATLLLVISVSYSIHVINHFLNKFRLSGSRKEALEYAFRNSAWPCFITCATTAIGFASFIAVPMGPIRNVGIVCAFGVLITYFLVITIIPILYSFGKEQKKIKPAKKNIFNFGELRARVMERWANLVVKKPLITVIITILIVGLAIFFTFYINIESDFIEMIGNRNKFVRDAKYISKNLGGLYSYEVLIELPEEGMAKNPEVLKSLEKMHKLVESFKTTKISTSVNNILKDINMTLNNNKNEYFVVPDDKNYISQCLLLYEMSGGEELDELIDYDYKFLRLSVEATKFTTDLKDNFNKIEEFGLNNFPEGTKITITGDIPIMLKSISTLVNGQILSILCALIGITIMMILILKSIRVGLLSMIPNIIPICVVTGAMGLFKIPLDMYTIMVAPMLVGIAVDDTVHYFVHFRQEYSKSGDYKAANINTFKNVGTAILFTSVILSLGFSAFGLSTVRSMVNLAILLGLGIITALIADLFITPVLFVYLKPFNKKIIEKNQKEIKEDVN